MLHRNFEKIRKISFSGLWRKKINFENLLKSQISWFTQIWCKLVKTFTFLQSFPGQNSKIFNLFWVLGYIFNYYICLSYNIFNETWKCFQIDIKIVDLYPVWNLTESTIWMPIRNQTQSTTLIGWIQTRFLNWMPIRSRNRIPNCVEMDPGLVPHLMRISIWPCKLITL